MEIRDDLAYSTILILHTKGTIIFRIRRIIR